MMASVTSTRNGRPVAPDVTSAEPGGQSFFGAHDGELAAVEPEQGALAPQADVTRPSMTVLPLRGSHPDGSLRQRGTGSTLSCSVTPAPTSHVCQSGAPRSLGSTTRSSIFPVPMALPAGPSPPGVLLPRWLSLPLSLQAPGLLTPFSC
jgi:hypothetical protein